MYRLGFLGIDILELSEWTVCIRLILAMLCGATFGIERARKRRAAGMRTFILISTGSCLIMMISQFLNMAYQANSDLGRMGAQVISGIGFICAGSILLTGHYKVTGLTTAASLWAAASVGLAIGAGFYLGAVSMCAIMLIAMFGLDGYRDHIGTMTEVLHLYFIVEDKTSAKETVVYLKNRGFAVSELSSAPSELLEGVGFICLLRAKAKVNRRRTMEDIQNLPNVMYVEEI